MNLLLGLLVLLARRWGAVEMFDGAAAQASVEAILRDEFGVGDAG